MYQEGNIKYYNAGDGKIYKQVGDGAKTLVDPKNYKYVPKAAGGTRDDGPSSGSGAAKDTSAQKETAQSVLEQLRQALPNNDYSYPYEQLQRDLLSFYPQAQYQSEADMLGEAKNYADLQVSSQLLALQQALEQAGVDAKAQQKTIEAAYSGMANQLAQAAEQQKAQALESAIARGGGRSGVVDWSNAKINEAQTQQLSQAEAQKAAQMTNAANQLAALQKQYAGQIGQLEGQRGSLSQQYLANLKNQNYANEVNAFKDKWGAASDLSGKALNARQFRDNTTLGYANAFGQMPAIGTPTAGAPAQPASTATAAKPINLNNEKAYLTNRYNSALKSGNTGLANWAKNQAKQYGFSI